MTHAPFAAGDPGGVTGGILALRDTDGDGRPDVQQRFGDTGGNGTAWGEGQLYFAPNDRVVRYDFTGSELVPSAAPVTVVEGLPIGGDHPRAAARGLPGALGPLGMTFYTGTAFGNKYEGGLFIAFHGSRFDPRLQPAGPGYNVVFVNWANGKPVGKFEVFADGFAGGDPSPTGAAHRPVSVAEAPDGSLYISDDKGGWIYRVVRK